MPKMGMASFKLNVSGAMAIWLRTILGSNALYSRGLTFFFLCMLCNEFVIVRVTVPSVSPESALIWDISLFLSHNVFSFATAGKLNTVDTNFSVILLFYLPVTLHTCSLI